MLIRDIAAGLLIGAGCFFIISGGVGLFRMKTFFTRIHAASLTDTGGASLVLAGLMLVALDYPTAFWLVIKLLLLLLFLLFTSPTAAHALARAAMKHEPSSEPAPRSANATVVVTHDNDISDNRENHSA